MKVYISGPMTGYEDFNKPAFFAAEKKIRDLGFDPVNPVNNGVPEDAKWQDHMRADIKLLMDCDAIVMLDDWLYSDGACLERDLARRLKMPCIAFHAITKDSFCDESHECLVPV